MILIKWLGIVTVFYFSIEIIGRCVGWLIDRSDAAEEQEATGDRRPEERLDEHEQR